MTAAQLGQRDTLFAEELVPATPSADPEPSVVTCADLAELASVAELADREPPAVVVLLDRPEDDPAVAAGRALDAVQAWLAEDRFAGSRLALHTRNARRDPAASAVWGLVRSAQQEHPDRFLLVDVEDPDVEDLDVEAARMRTRTPRTRTRTARTIVRRSSRTPTSPPRSGTCQAGRWSCATVYRSSRG